MKQQYPNKMKPHLLDKSSYRRILLSLLILKIFGGGIGELPNDPIRLVPRSGWFRDELQTVHEAPGDISGEEADYGEVESPAFISALAQPDIVASPRIVEAPNLSEASSPSPPLTPHIRQPVFSVLDPTGLLVTTSIINAKNAASHIVVTLFALH